MELAGIGADTPDPKDGVIERDASGKPTGLMHEGAMELFGKVLPPHSAEEYAEGLTAARDYLHSVGVTGWQEAILGKYAGYPDRKSTRLNSSHVASSYAVFCLKNKSKPASSIDSS